jgi:hypothetical protein
VCGCSDRAPAQQAKALNSNPSTEKKRKKICEFQKHIRTPRKQLKYEIEVVIEQFEEEKAFCRPLEFPGKGLRVICGLNMR